MKNLDKTVEYIDDGHFFKLIISWPGTSCIGLAAIWWDGLFRPQLHHSLHHYLTQNISVWEEEGEFQSLLSTMSSRRSCFLCQRALTC